jgi:hypothetical protein
MVMHRDTNPQLRPANEQSLVVAINLTNQDMASGSVSQFKIFYFAVSQQNVPGLPKRTAPYVRLC